MDFFLMFSYPTIEGAEQQDQWLSDLRAYFRRRQIQAESQRLYRKVTVPPFSLRNYNDRRILVIFCLLPMMTWVIMHP